MCNESWNECEMHRIFSKLFTEYISFQQYANEKRNLFQHPATVSACRFSCQKIFSNFSNISLISWAMESSSRLLILNILTIVPDRNINIALHRVATNLIFAWNGGTFPASQRVIELRVIRAEAERSRSQLRESGERRRRRDAYSRRKPGARKSRDPACD